MKIDKVPTENFEATGAGNGMAKAIPKNNG